MSAPGTETRASGTATAKGGQKPFVQHAPRRGLGGQGSGASGGPPPQRRASGRSDARARVPRARRRASPGRTPGEASRPGFDLDPSRHAARVHSCPSPLSARTSASASYAGGCGSAACIAGNSAKDAPGCASARSPGSVWRPSRSTRARASCGRGGGSHHDRATSRVAREDRLREHEGIGGRPQSPASRSSAWASVSTAGGCRTRAPRGRRRGTPPRPASRGHLEERTVRGDSEPVPEDERQTVDRPGGAREKRAREKEDAVGVDLDDSTVR